MQSNVWSLATCRCGYVFCQQIYEFFGPPKLRLIGSYDGCSSERKKESKYNYSLLVLVVLAIVLAAVLFLVLLIVLVVLVALAVVTAFDS